MESVEITAKKIEDAVKEGLDRLSDFLAKPKS